MEELLDWTVAAVYYSDEKEPVVAAVLDSAETVAVLTAAEISGFLVAVAGSAAETLTSGIVVAGTAVADFAVVFVETAFVETAVVQVAENFVVAAAAVVLGHQIL